MSKRNNWGKNLTSIQLLQKDSWGLDFRRDGKLVKTAYGQYSTELFSTEAERIIAEHDLSKVGLIVIEYVVKTNSRKNYYHRLRSWVGAGSFVSIIIPCSKIIGVLRLSRQRSRSSSFYLYLFSSANHGYG